MNALLDVVWSLSGVVALLLVPGPTNTLLAAAGALAPERPPLALAVAELAGYLVSVSVLALIGGLAAAAAPSLVPVVRFALALYLGRLAFGLWRAPDASSPAAAVSPQRIFVATLFNPKGAVFAFAFLPVAAPPAMIAAWYVGFAASVLGAGTLWVLAGRRMGSLWGAAASKLLPRFAAVVLAGFALALAGRTIAAIG